MQVSFANQKPPNHTLFIEACTKKTKLIIFQSLLNSGSRVLELTNTGKTNSAILPAHKQPLNEGNQKNGK